MAIDMPRNRRNGLPQPELLFLPIESVQQLAEIRDALTAAGHSRSKVAGCIEFLLGQTGGDDRSPRSQAAEYRRMLAGLVEEPFGGGPETPIRLVAAA